MNPYFLGWLAWVSAGIPSALFLLNCLAYRRTSRAVQSSGSVSVLIPARNEALNIRATLESILANPGDFEVIVLDDHSTDGTGAIVAALAARDARLRLEEAPPLPRGWCGKQHACHVLAGLASHPLLLFIDADVRLAPNAIARLAQWMESRKVALASGVPRQELGTLSEQLLLPLIHFILLGFLPIHAMRRTGWAVMSAGCGQLFIACKADYEKAGGHARIRDSLHDGIKLPRVFREAGFRTDLLDATDLATCRMYRSNRETWRGLGKNATEGLGAPETIGPMTALLLAGQILPWCLLMVQPSLSSLALVLVSVLPRFVAVVRFHQPVLGAILHPLGILSLLLIQWQALLRQLRGKPAEWKGRSYQSTPPVTPSHSIKIT